MTFTVGGVGTAAGAVYRPAELIVPHADPLQPDPLTLQVTLVLVLPVTAAWNWRCAPSVTSALVGEMVSDIGTAMVTCAEADLLGSA